jgi:hypothetical protein
VKCRLLIWELFATAMAFAGERMNVAVCNVNQIPGTVIERAEAEASYVFRAMDVEVHWTSCGAEIAARDAPMRPDFIVRVQVGGHITRAGPASLEAMGQAFLDAGGVGYLADAYYNAIHELTLVYPIAGGSQVLGYTMAHELGHLLIGPAHQPSGIMRAAWRRKELEALTQRLLKFNEAERATILRRLRLRAASSGAAP